MPNKPFALSALIQHDVVDQLRKLIESREQRLGTALTATTADDLLTQLASASPLPKGLDLDFLREIGGLAVARIFDGDDPLDRIRNLFVGQLDALGRLLRADSPQAALSALRDTFAGPLAGLWRTVGPVLTSQLNIAISFATTAALMPKTAGPAIEESVLTYFFTRDGFRTIDASQLVAPIHLEDLDVGKATAIKGIFSQRTGDRYIRDLIRVVVESADDARYDLRKRYDAALTLAKDKRSKYEDWFKGFSSMAEGAVTSAVEQACMGAATFQTNPLIAAAAGTFAGTAARKATQHVFLAEIEHLRLRR
jgi:hypothetical protein